MDSKKAKRRRNLRLILAFFALLWLGFSIRWYYHDTSAARIYTQRSWNSQEVFVWITREGDEYVCKLDNSRAPFSGNFKFEHEYNSYASRTRSILKEEWGIKVVDDHLPADADKEKLFDEGYALLVAQGLRSNWPIVTRAQAKNYVVEYPALQAKNKRFIALEALGVVGLRVGFLCAVVLVARYVWFVAHERPRPGICPDCDYNLGGLQSQQCPECGRAFDDKEWRFHMSE